MFVSPGQQFHSFSNGLGRREVEIRTYGKDEISLPRKNLPVQAEGFSDYPFYPISPNGAPKLAADTDSHPTLAKVIAMIDEGKALAVQPFPLIVYDPVLPAFAQLRVFGE